MTLQEARREWVLIDGDCRRVSITECGRVFILNGREITNETFVVLSAPPPAEDWRELGDDLPSPAYYWCEDLAADQPPQLLRQSHYGRVSVRGGVFVACENSRPVWERWTVAGWTRATGRVALCSRPGPSVRPPEGMPAPSGDGWYWVEGFSEPREVSQSSDGGWRVHGAWHKEPLNGRRVWPISDPRKGGGK